MSSSSSPYVFHWHYPANGPMVTRPDAIGEIGHEHVGGDRNHHHDSDGRALYPFEPDWCIAPAATLEDWMQENNMSARVMAASVATGPESRHQAQMAIEDALARKPLTQPVADLLQDATGIPAKFWMNHEHNYRAGLAAGLKDVTV